jgi:nuclear pore complex protein Nup205
MDQENFQNARLALLQQLAQTRAGAKHILHANLMRTLEASGLFAADPELQIRAGNPRALAQHYDLLAKTVRIIGAALVSRGSHNVVQGRRFLSDHRMLVAHALKRSAGIGTGAEDVTLEEKVEDLAEALIVVIAATGFLEVCFHSLRRFVLPLHSTCSSVAQFEDETVQQTKTQNESLFH